MAALGLGAQILNFEWWCCWAGAMVHQNSWFRNSRTIWFSSLQAWAHMFEERSKYAEVGDTTAKTSNWPITRWSKLGVWGCGVGSTIWWLDAICNVVESGSNLLGCSQDLNLEMEWWSEWLLIVWQGQFPRLAFQTILLADIPSLYLLLIILSLYTCYFDCLYQLSLIIFL